MGTALTLAMYQNGTAITGASVVMPGAGGPEDLTRALYQLQTLSHNVVRPTLTPGKATGTALTMALYSNGVAVPNATQTMAGAGGMEDLSRVFRTVNTLGRLSLHGSLTPGH